MSDPKPKIACLPNGPYYLINDPTPRTVANLQDAQGQACTTVQGVALCRCGGSGNKPFCDGTHGRNGFSDEKHDDRLDDQRVSYVGSRITIHDNRGVCAHAGVCTDRLKRVFRMGEEPWIDPDGASSEEIIETVSRCPSGALSYSLEGTDGPEPNPVPLVTASKDGPFVVSGGIELVGQTFGEGASPDRYTLCRCGASKNKPFCDGSHWHVGFKDGD